MPIDPKITRPGRARFRRISWRDLLFTALPLALVAAAGIWAVMHFIRPAPPEVVTISTGPEGSSFQRAAERYAKAFEGNGVTLRLRPSNGSLENLRRLADPNGDVDVAFVQVGVRLPEAKPDEPRRELSSLGTIARQPMYILVRGAAPPDRLAALAGKRLRVGPDGSGTRFLALALLEANGVKPDGVTLVDVDDEAVADALEQGELDAAFLMGDSASPRVIRRLIRTPGVHVVRLSQVEAYLRRFQDLDRVVIPMGAYDLAQNLPPQDLDLVASAVEVVARADLHPAISDLFIETMRGAHGRGTLLQKAGEFPAPREYDVPLSADAKRYYESGKRWAYRVLPFWAASLADRFLVVLVPLVLLLVPVFRVMPSLYTWRVRQRLYKVYASLLQLERDVLGHALEDRHALVARLDEIEERVDALKLPIAFADQFYVLREHVALVRRRLTSLAQEPEAKGGSLRTGGG